MRMQKTQQKRGFTIIEMLVSLAIFAIVITMSVGTLLVLIAGNQQTQERSSTMSNLSFALDSMTRDIRTGTDFYCGEESDFTNQEAFTEGNDCSNGDLGISFVETGGSITGPAIDRIAFFVENNALWRQIGNNAPEQVTASNIYIHEAEFIVTGAERLSDPSPGDDLDQPMVTITLEASDIENAGVACSATGNECIRVQTTVTQRVLDI